MPRPVIAGQVCLTDYFLVPRTGRVHSCFERVVNIAFPSTGEPPQLLTLLRQGLPSVPDSFTVPESALDALRELEHAHAFWDGHALTVGSMRFFCPEWQPVTPEYFRLTPSAARRYLDLYSHLPQTTGLDDVPARMLAKAQAGLGALCDYLLTGQIPSVPYPVGLGKGTTPAADDMMVGILSALGGIYTKKSVFPEKNTIFSPEMLATTTDISVKYLRGAQEGYFSSLVRSVWNHLDLPALQSLLAFGASSGADMLCGMALACRTFLQKEEIPMSVKEIIAQKKLIAIVRGLPADQLEGLAEALYAGGIGLMEITFNQQKPETWEQTAAGIKMLKEKFDGRIIPGAGTVVSLDQLDMAYKAGAQYIISPNVDEEIIKQTKRYGLVSLPGAMTPSEIVVAYKAGADFVKVFPVGNLGAAYIKAVKAPLSHIPIMAVGGVNEKNAADFLKAGAAGLGVGGNLVNKEWIANGEWEKITALAAEFVKAVQSV